MGKTAYSNDNGDVVVATTVLQTERQIKQDKITYNRPGSYSSAVLLRFSPEGDCIWIRGGVSEGAGSASTAKDVAIDNDGNCYLIGEYMGGQNTTGKLTFNESSVAFPLSVPKVPACGGIFLTKYNAEGVSQYTSNSGTNLNVSNQKPKAFFVVLSTNENNVYVLGRFSKDFTIWDNTGENAVSEIKNDAQSSFFIATFNKDVGTFKSLTSGEVRNC